MTGGGRYRSVAKLSLSLLFDVVLSGVAFLLAIMIRAEFEGGFFFSYDDHLVPLFVFMGIAGAVSFVMGLHKGVWRFSSIHEAVLIAKTAILSTLLFSFAMFLLSRMDNVPRSLLVIAPALMIVLLAAPRVCYRLWRNARIAAAKEVQATSKKAVLLIGANENSDRFIRAVSERSEMRYELLGLIDESGSRAGRTIRGVPVLGSIDDLSNVVARLLHSRRLTTLVLTRRRASLEPALFDVVADVATKFNLGLLRIPDYAEVQDSKLDLRPIEIEDLLQRRPITLDVAQLSALASNACVLVTGAGGSIGSELCRQLLALKPSQLVLLDSSEYHLYMIDHELKKRASHTEIVALLGDVRNRDAMFVLLQAFKPTLVFHAAALKHVPVVENQPLEGLLTNCVGTQNVADAAVSARASAFVLISTDKAVNPTSVMGASKRLAEMYCQALDRTGATHFVVVRFGNVLGSTGSVVPLFNKQIADGGPVTVTHAEIKRYFMTIPEAAQLVLHAMKVALEPSVERGGVFVLDMGEPIRIADLARRMISLAGLRPEIDVRIAYTGLRPGEKLFEELFSSSEALSSTAADGVLMARPESPNLAQLRVAFEELSAAIQRSDTASGLGLLKRVVREYAPDERISHASTA